MLETLQRLKPMLCIIFNHSSNSELHRALMLYSYLPELSCKAFTVMEFEETYSYHKMTFCSTLKIGDSGMVSFPV